MAYFSRTIAKITPENFSSERLKSVTVRVCITDCTGGFLHHGHPPAGRAGGNGMGGASLGTEVDAGWLSL